MRAALEPVTATPMISLVIPALNEEGAIGPTLRRVPRSVVGQVIVVDGQSSDNTVAEARQAGADVIVETRRGYGRACLTGAEHAAAAGASIVVFMDGDGADEVEQVARLIAPIQAGEADFVLADRTGPGREPGSMGAHQIAAGLLIGLAVRAVAGVRYRDMCAFRAIRPADLLRLSMREMHYGWNLEMQIRAARAGLRVREVPMPYRCRVAGESKVAGSVRGTVKAGRQILRTLAIAGLGPL